jgi:hypothetical protein
MLNQIAFRIDPLAWLDWPWVFLKPSYSDSSVRFNTQKVPQQSIKKEGKFSYPGALPIFISLALWSIWRFLQTIVDGHLRKPLPCCLHAPYHSLPLSQRKSEVEAACAYSHPRGLHKPPFGKNCHGLARGSMGI